MDDNIFAEVDIEPAQNSEAQNPAFPKDEVLRSKVMHPAWRDQLVSLAQPIVPRAPDPIRERFYEMRRLAAKPPFPRNTSELFYRQARFMEDFEDNYEGSGAVFNMYFPCYQQMGYDYLRTYFTWRTKVRGGDIAGCDSLSYVFLYIYELLSGIGVDSPNEGLQKLIDIWNTYAPICSPIRYHMPGWLKDYHIFYELPQSFLDFVNENGLRKYYFLTFLLETQAENRLEAWSGFSAYDIERSRFCRDGNEEMMTKCFDTVIDAIQEFCAKKGAGLEDMLVYSVSRRSPWRPFKNALFDSRVRQNDREVHISKYERYYCKNNQWTASLPIYYSSQKDFIGYIIKKTEACLRNASGYKYKLATEMKPGSKPFRELQRTAANRAELDRVISRAVEDFYRDRNRVVVTVDHKSLSRIREEALETQEQLIVEDTESDRTVIADSGQQSPDNIYFEETPQTLSFSDGWKALGNALTDTEREALKLALNGGNTGGTGDIKSFADEKGVMLEVLIDGINEKASECIGDSIMELADEAYIFEEYKAYLSDML